MKHDHLHSHQYKWICHTRCICSNPKKASGKKKAYGYGGDFDMNIDVPAGGDPPATPNMTVTGTCTVNLTTATAPPVTLWISAWYSNSMNVQTAINQGVQDSGVAAVATDLTGQTWTVTFPTPTAPDDYTFTIQGSYSDPSTLIGAITIVTVSAPFEIGAGSGGSPGPLAAKKKTPSAKTRKSR
jgi:hypothetical protein